MKAVKYKVKISIDAVHNWGDQIIKEIFVPELFMVVNERGFAFYSAEARGDIELEEIEIDDDVVASLEAFAKANKKLKNIIESIF